jgi:lantibiotic transport system permease protein
MSFAISVRAEILKTKRSAAFWLSVLGAGFIPLIFFLMYFFKPDVIATQLKNNAWENHFMAGWQSLSAFLLPMFIILTCSLIPQIEFKNNTWKQVFASPQSLGNIFFSKFLTIHLMILFCFLLFNLFMMISAVTVNLVNKNYQFLSQPIDWIFLVKLSFKTYMSILGISAIQYWISLRFKNFITPIGIGLALLITSLILLRWEHIYKVPYAHPVLTFMEIKKKQSSLLANHEWNSIGYFIAFTALAFADMKFRKEKG